MKLAKTLTIGLALTALTSSAFASGGYGGGGFRQNDRTVQRAPADPVYEQGKAVFKNKVRDYGKIKYCVTAPGTTDGSKLKRKTLKPYAGGNANELANNLYNCNDPTQKIVEVLSRDDLIAVIYYLNKRYRLNLTA